MTIFRVVCTEDSAQNNKIYIDFAAADVGVARLTHYQLLKLRQYETPMAAQILPPVNLEDDAGELTLAFDKPEKASAEEKTKLQQLDSRIKLEYQKFKHKNQYTSIELTDENFACIYDFIDPYKPAHSAEEENLYKKIRHSLWLQGHKNAARSPKTKMTLAERLARYRGD